MAEPRALLSAFCGNAVVQLPTSNWSAREQLAVVVDQRHALLPRRGLQPLGDVVGPQRGQRGDRRDPDAGARQRPGADDELAPRHALAQRDRPLGHLLLDLLLHQHRPLLDALALVDHLPPRDHGGDGQEHERQAEAEAEQLRVVAVEDVEQDERDRARSRRQQRADDDELAPRAAALHRGSRSPIRRAMSSSDAMARNQAIMPSGIGPTWPMPQPPASSGCTVERT